VSYSDGLNPQQAEAVVHGDGPLVVFAGAGSGKTRVITHRVAHLVGERGFRPWRILAVTFTNKAAREMRERLGALLGAQARDLWVGTFHATCARLMRLHAEQIGVRRDFVIYDDSDQKAMVTRIVRDLKIDERRYPPRRLQAEINRAKQEALGPERYQAGNPFEAVAQQVYNAYHKRMTESGALDFGDLIFRLVDAMGKNPELLHDLQGRFDHVLVDEYQDTNHVQYLLIHRLCAAHQNLCVVGDDDQSIYRWRGADRRNILDFTRHFPAARLIKLEQNYRSTKRILRAANAVVSRNVDREEKRLWTDNEAGAPVTVMACGDERDEAALLVSAMKMLLEAGYARRELALLYRTHAQARVFEENLRFAELPYRVVGGVRFYDRAEVKDLLAYLRLLHNPDDDVSLLRVINTPTRGIGKTTVGRLLEQAARSGISVHRALELSASESVHSAGAKKALGRFAALLGSLRAQLAEGAGPADLAQAVLEESGYREQLEAEDSPEADARIENLQEVVGSMVEFERDAEEPTLASFLELVTLETEADRAEDGDVITLMTVHAAKGLEFPVVMVAGLEEDTFPHKNATQFEDPEAIEEERRLAYVAFTRAEQRLFLSHAERRTLYGQTHDCIPSRFLDEIPAEELEHVGGRARRRSRPAPSRDRAWGTGGWGLDSAGGSGRAGSSVGAAAGDSYVDHSEVSDVGEVELRRGMRVRHRKFGVGQVSAVSPGVPPQVTVVFPGWGEKTLVSSYLEPA